MKLNEFGKEKIRKYIIEHIKEIPDDERIKLNKDLLENIIFYDTYVYSIKLKRNVKARLIVWSGNWLQKIDLSEISFDNVLWDVNIIKKFHKDVNINLAHTNANIDFSKASLSNFDENNKISLYSCDLTDVDLSKSNYNYIGDAKYCNFSNTNININNLSDGIFDRCIFNDCNGKGFEIKFDELYRKFFLSSFINAGINITTEDTEIANLRRYLTEQIKNGSYQHCYVNGNYIKTSREKEEIKQKLKNEYFRFIEGNIDKVYDVINIAKSKRKKK